MAMGFLSQEIDSIKKERDDSQENIAKLSQKLGKTCNLKRKKPQRMSASLIQSDKKSRSR